MRPARFLLTVLIASACAVATLGIGRGMAESPAPAAGCSSTLSTEAKTNPESGESSGTAPGNAGSTGWTGGTGGSNIGTSQEGSTSGSEQPETAQGLDLKTNRSVTENGGTKC